MPSIPLPQLSRDAFVANALWVGVTLACQGQLDEALDFRGTPLRGAISAENGQGDSLEVAWDDQGVVVLVHEKGEPTAPTPDPPLELRGLTQQAMADSLNVTAWLWIKGNNVGSSSLREWPKESFLGLVEAFCGPSLRESDGTDDCYALERALFDAILDGQHELTDAIVAALLEGPLDELSDALECSRLEAARLLADDLSRFGLLWRNVEDVEDVAE